MSETPRNQALRRMVAARPVTMVGTLLEKHRQLELELSAATKERDELRRIVDRHQPELCDEIRMERDALRADFTAQLDRYNRLYNAHQELTALVNKLTTHPIDARADCGMMETSR